MHVKCNQDIQSCSSDAVQIGERHGKALLFEKSLKASVVVDLVPEIIKMFAHAAQMRNSAKTL